MIKNHILLFLLVHFIFGTESKSAEVKRNAEKFLKAPYVLLISIDGFRADYLDKYKPANLLRMAKSGARAKSLIPIYPSLTFPNHISIITGLYAENHGIVGNRFYDPKRREIFAVGTPAAVNDGSWYSGVPLWSLAEREGMVSATYFWPGSEAQIGGFRPTYFIKYDMAVPSQDRVNQVIEWLKLPEAERPHFVTLYYSIVDSAGHIFGAATPEVGKAVEEVDASLGDLFKKLDTLNLPINVVVLSDHGMLSPDPTKRIFIKDWIDLSKFEVFQNGIQISLIAKDSADVQPALKKLQLHLPRIAHASLRKNLPRSLHIGKNPRVGDIFIWVDSPYTISTDEAHAVRELGKHGYSPFNTPEMHGIFLARGPNIRKNHLIESFANVHVYPFIRKILGLKKQEKIDGNERVLLPIYKE